MNTSSSRRYKLPGLVKLLLLALVYVLSLGPVIALYSSHRLEGPMPDALAKFYVPAYWVREHHTFGRLMTTHDDWWRSVLKQSPNSSAGLHPMAAHGTRPNIGQ